MVNRLAVCVVLAVTAACTPPTQHAESTSMPNPTTTTAAPQPEPEPLHERGPDEVLIRLGEIDLGNNIDGFVSTSELVVYGNGDAYAYLYDDETNSLQPTTTRLTNDEVASLLQLAEQLPPESPPPLANAVDHVPFRIVVNGQLWMTNSSTSDGASGGPVEQPILEVVDKIRRVVMGGAVTWSPVAWIERRAAADHCSVVVDPSESWFNRAPVYPHLESRFPLGTLPC